MNPNRRLSFLGGFIGILIVVEIIYGITGYQSKLNIIHQNREEMSRIQQRKNHFDERKEELPLVENELKRVSMQKQALLSRIPYEKAHSKEIAELARYLDMNHFYDIGMETIEKEDPEEIHEALFLKHYDIHFVGNYHQIIELIDKLNHSYQTVYLEQMTLSNEIQDLEEEENWKYYWADPEHFNEMVKAQISLSFYVRKLLEEPEEIYQPDYHFGQNSGSIFERQEEGEMTDFNDIELIIEDEETKMPLDRERILTKEKDRKSVNVLEEKEEMEVIGHFTVIIEDEETLGDTYKLDGPGESGKDYIGLSTKADVEIRIEVFDDFYRMRIEDEKGEVKETEDFFYAEYPKVHIVSNMKKVKESMPQIQMRLINHTDEVMTVSMSGSLLEQISLVNENGELFIQGERKDKVEWVSE